MGGLMSKAVKPIKNFNIENRAERVLQSDKPRPSPRHPSTAAAYEKLIHEYPELLDEQQKKVKKLDEHLKIIKVDSVGDNPEIRPKVMRPKPEERRKAVIGDFGIYEPDNIPDGRVSIRQAFDFISQHHLDPQQNTVGKIAIDYRMNLNTVQNIVNYFQVLNLHIPKDMLDKNPKLLVTMQSLEQQQQSIASNDTDRVKRIEENASSTSDSVSSHIKSRN